MSSLGEGGTRYTQLSFATKLFENPQFFSRYKGLNLRVVIVTQCAMIVSKSSINKNTKGGVENNAKMTLAETLLKTIFRHFSVGPEQFWTHWTLSKNSASAKIEVKSSKIVFYIFYSEKRSKTGVLINFFCQKLCHISIEHI